MTADCDRCQRIVNAEFTRNVNLHREVQKTFHMVGNTKVSLSAHKLCILSTEICFFGKSISFQITGMSFNDLIKMLIVPVHDSYTALLEKHGFAMKIIIIILMLIRSDMVWLDIGKNTEIKDKSLSSVQHQSL